MILRSVIFLTICSVSVLFASCARTSNPNDAKPIDSTAGKVTKSPDDTTLIASYPALPYDSSFSPGVRLGSISKDTLVEASGICASRRYPGCFWIENDSKNPADVVLVDSTGRVRAVIHIANASNNDWEDICIGPGPVAGVNYLYIGDIGDNNNANSYCTVYRVPEPDVTLGASVFVSTATDVTPIRFRYVDGPHNAESLLIDPVSKDLYIASKGGVANIYVARYPQPDTLFTLKKIGVLPFLKLTAGDISPDGTEILLKNTENVYYWKRTTGETVLSALMRNPHIEPYTVETQGEAICWSVNADAYYTTSEYNAPTISGLWKYTRK